MAAGLPDDRRRRLMIDGKIYHYVAEALPIHTPFYHWAFKNKVNYLEKGINEEIMAYLCGEAGEANKALNRKMTLNGGLYISDDPIKWRQYGDTLNEIRFKGMIYMLDVKSLMTQSPDLKISPSEFIEKIGFSQLRREGISVLYHKDCPAEYTVIDHRAFDMAQVDLRSHSLTVQGIPGREQFMYQTEVLPKGTRFYHWTHELRQLTYTSDLSIDQMKEVLNFHVSFNKDSTLAGGLYVGRNPFDWCGFNECYHLVVVELTRDVKVLKIDSMMSQLDGYEISVNDFVNRINKAELQKEHISILTHKDHPNDYCVTNHTAIKFVKPDLEKELCLRSIDELSMPIPRNFARPDYSMWARARTMDEKLYQLFKTYQALMPWRRYFDFMLSFEFIDLFDIILNLSKRATRQVWETYQDNTLMNWQKNELMRKCFLWAENELRNHPGKVLYGDLTGIDIVDKPIKAHGKYSEINSLAELRAYCFERLGEIFATEPRKSSVNAGGGIDRATGKVHPETIDTSNGDHPFRASAEHVEALRRNPLVVVIEDTSAPVVVYGADRLVRYRYIDIRDFENLKRSFPALNELNAEHHSAPDPEEFTVKLISYIKKSILQDDSIDELTRYVRLMSLHPFKDFNGRTCRAFYKVMTGQPLILINWDFDLLLSRDQLERMIAQSTAYWKLIQQKLTEVALEKLACNSLSVVCCIELCKMFKADLAIGTVTANSLIEKWMLQVSTYQSKKAYFDMMQELTTVLSRPAREIEAGTVQTTHPAGAARPLPGGAGARPILGGAGARALPGGAGARPLLGGAGARLIGGIRSGAAIAANTVTAGGGAASASSSTPLLAVSAIRQGGTASSSSRAARP